MNAPLVHALAATTERRRPTIARVRIRGVSFRRIARPVSADERWVAISLITIWLDRHGDTWDVEVFHRHSYAPHNRWSAVASSMEAAARFALDRKAEMQREGV